MRAKDSKEFDHIYHDEIFKDPNALRYVCYLRAEAIYLEKTGKRKYSGYDSFRKCFCVRNRAKTIRINKK